MTDVTNGDQIVESLLSDCVTETPGLNKNDPNQRILVDLEPLGSSGGRNCINSDQQQSAPAKEVGTAVLRDLISFKKESAANKLLCHPVIATLIDVRWKKLRNFFLVNFLLYTLFLVTYSCHLGRIFW